MNLSAVVFGLICMLSLCKIIVLFDKWLVSFIIALKSKIVRGKKSNDCTMVRSFITKTFMSLLPCHFEGFDCLLPGGF